MAARYAGVAEPYDDLLQVASLALVMADDRFDPTRGTPFLGFAKPTILGELKRHFRDKTWTIRAPRSLHDLLGRIDRASEELSAETGRPPTVEVLARRLEVDADEVLEALELQYNRRPISLDAPPPGEEEGTAEEWIGRSDDSFTTVEDRAELRSLLPGLDAREAMILRLRFVEELPQTRIAELIGCSQMQVSRLLRRALERLREEAEAADGDGRSRPPARRT
jgi:RNA polymerase sigma-B factor